MNTEELLNQSIEAMERGNSVRAELDRLQTADGPEETAELESLLVLAHRLRQTRHEEETRGPAMSQAQFDRSLQRLHARLEVGTNGRFRTNGHTPKGETNGYHNGAMADTPAQTPASAPVVSRPKNRRKKTLLERYAGLAVHPILRAAAVVIALLLAGMGLTVASADSLPNSPLYPIKRTTEQIQTQMVSGPAATRWHLELADRRLSEIRSLTQTGKSIAPDLVGEMKNEYRMAVAMVEQHPDAATHGTITQHLAQARQTLENLAPQVPAPARPAISNALDEIRLEQERLEGNKPVPAGGFNLYTTPTEKATATVMPEETQAVSPTLAPSATWTPGQERERSRVAPASTTRPAETAATPTARREGSREETATPASTGTAHSDIEQPAETEGTATPQPGTFGPHRDQPGGTPGPGGGTTPIPAVLPVTPLPTRHQTEAPPPTPTPLPRREGPPPSPTYVVRSEHPRPTETPEPRREPPTPTATPEIRRDRPSPTPTRVEDEPPRPTETPSNNPVPPTATPAYRGEHEDPTPTSVGR